MVYADSNVSPPMPSIEVKKNCICIRPSYDSVYVIKKEAIVGYSGSTFQGSRITIYTNISKLEICISADGKEYEKFKGILDSILSPEVQATGDLLAL
jgi:hypothetical protein